MPIKKSNTQQADLHFPPLLITSDDDNVSVFEEDEASKGERARRLLQLRQTADDWESSGSGEGGGGRKRILRISPVVERILKLIGGRK